MKKNNQDAIFLSEALTNVSFIGLLFIPAE